MLIYDLFVIFVDLFSGQLCWELFLFMSYFLMGFYFWSAVYIILTINRAMSMLIVFVTLQMPL